MISSVEEHEWEILSVVSTEMELSKVFFFIWMETFLCILNDLLFNV